MALLMADWELLVRRAAAEKPPASATAIKALSS
jgi:hypothetical protein